MAPLSTQMQHEKEKYKKEAKSVGAWPVFKKLRNPDMVHKSYLWGQPMHQSETRASYYSNWCERRGTCREFQKNFKLLDGNGAAKKKALVGVAADAGQKITLLFGFNAFRHNRQTQTGA
jgi:hypothetical protein